MQKLDPDPLEALEAASEDVQVELINAQAISPHEPSMEGEPMGGSELHADHSLKATPLEEVASEEAAKSIIKLPWWRRIFARWPQRAVKAPLVKAPAAEELMPAVAPAEVIPLPEAAIETPQVIESLPETAASATPSFSLDDVRATVNEELERAQADLSRLVQAELAHQQQDRQRALLSSAQETVEGIYTSKIELVHMELEALKEQAQHTLKNYTMPLRERMEELDFIRQRQTQAEKEISEAAEAIAAKRVAEAGHRLTELDGRGIVVGLCQEVEQQRQILDSLEARLTALPRLKAAGSSLWTILLGLILVAVMGTAGILLPPAELKSEANAKLMVDTAALYQATGKPNDAIRVLGDVVQAGIQDTDTLGRAGELYRVLKAYDRAIAVLTQAVKQDPKNETYLLSLARSYGDAGRHQEAIAEYQALVKINPAQLIYYMELGARYRSLKNYDLALAQYQKTLEIQPQYWLAYHALGDLYREQSRYEEAIAQYQQALQINPESYFSWVNAGLSYAGKRDHAKAIEQYQAAIAIDPNRAEAYFYTGEAYLAQGVFDEAIASYQEAIGKNEKYAAAYVGLGNVYVALGNCSKATPQFARALRLNPKVQGAEAGLEACSAP